MSWPNAVATVSPNYCESEDSSERLARRISAKINNSDTGSAFCPACFSDAIVPHPPNTLELLQAKHPPAPPDHSVPMSDNDISEVLDSISWPSPAVVRRAIKSFPS